MIREFSVPGQLGKDPSKYHVLKDSVRYPETEDSILLAEVITPNPLDRVVRAINTVVDVKEQEPGSESHIEAIIYLANLLTRKGMPLPLSGNGHNGSEKK